MDCRAILICFVNFSICAYDIVIYGKYIYGHSDVQNIFLRCIWLSYRVPGNAVEP